MKSISERTKKDLLYTMLKIRRFEEKIIELYPAQEMKTPVHLYIGQEAIAAGVCANLSKKDYVFTTHRNHGHYIAKGADLRLLVAELYGKVTGCSRGKGGSMHPTSVEYGICGTSAIVAGGVAIAVGTALSSKMSKNGKVSAAFFGDGAADEGTFHESLNFASLKKLPIVFVCENNFYATNSPLSARQPQDNISKRAVGYNMKGVRLDGNDVIKIYKAAQDAVLKARDGGGPTLIECITYRWRGHVGYECDYEKGCRPKKELDAWIKRCPIEHYKKYLAKAGMLRQGDVEKAKKEIDKDIASAVKFAKESPFPEKTELLKNVYYMKE